MAYLDKEKTIEAIRKYADVKHSNGEQIEYVNGILKSISIINEQPIADVYEEVHGCWIDTDKFDNFKTPIYQCSVCIKEVADNYIHLHKYCLHCGAKLDGGKNDE